MSMIRVILANGLELPHLLAQAWSLRHTVFRNQLGWQVASRNFLEYDIYDHEALHCYAVADDVVVGYWRAVNTLRPYLLEQHFSILLGTRPVPRSRHIWEISRFLISPDVPDRAALGRKMVEEAGQFGRRIAARELLAVVEPPFARFIRASGLPIRMESTPMIVGTGHRGLVKAVLIALDVEAHADTDGTASVLLAA